MTDAYGYAIAGGLLIGVSVTLLLLFNGRIAGICGMIAAAVLPGSAERATRLLFLGGLAIGTWLWHAVSGVAPEPTLASPWLLVAAGFIVGFGTQMGNGCTSHGVCGIARRSRRSIVATFLFMFSGALTVSFLRYVAGG